MDCGALIQCLMFNFEVYYLAYLLLEVSVVVSTSPIFMLICQEIIGSTYEV